MSEVCYSKSGNPPYVWIVSEVCKHGEGLTILAVLRHEPTEKDIQGYFDKQHHEYHEHDNEAAGEGIGLLGDYGEFYKIVAERHEVVNGAL